MSWGKKDWVDLKFMLIGSFIGTAVLGFLVAPLLGLELFGRSPMNYFLCGVVGTASGCILRFVVSKCREKKQCGYGMFDHS